MRLDHKYSCKNANGSSTNTNEALGTFSKIIKKKILKILFFLSEELGLRNKTEREHQVRSITMLAVKHKWTVPYYSVDVNQQGIGYSIREWLLWKIDYSK